jgi:hypothetical protein
MEYTFTSEIHALRDARARGYGFGSCKQSQHKQLIGGTQEWMDDMVIRLDIYSGSPRPANLIRFRAGECSQIRVANGDLAWFFRQANPEFALGDFKVMGDGACSDYWFQQFHRAQNETFGNETYSVKFFRQDEQESPAPRSFCKVTDFNCRENSNVTSDLVAAAQKDNYTLCQCSQMGYHHLQGKISESWGDVEVFDKSPAEELFLFRLHEGDCQQMRVPTGFEALALTAASDFQLVDIAEGSSDMPCPRQGYPQFVGTGPLALWTYNGYIVDSFIISPPSLVV